jgi:choline dehydrogenase-like flavoprotein
MNIGSSTKGTDFAIDVLGRYVCNTFEEALANSDPGFRSTATDINGNALPPRGDMRPFDFIVIGGGTFGAAVAEHLLFRTTGRSERILVLEAGPFLIPEHVQNLPSITITGEVWGQSWNGNVGFPGLAYCIGGRSAFWGGWSPRLLDSETAGRWPTTVLNDLNAQKLPNGDLGYFRQSGQQIGVTETNDYIFGELHTALRKMLFDAINGGSITAAMPLASLPDAPPVELLAPTAPTDAQLAELLGVALPSPVPSGLRAEALNLLKVEAPLAVQARSGHAGFFPLNKFSTIPLLIKAARTAYAEAPGDDVRKRLMVVPRCHVQRLNVINDAGGRRIDAVITERGPVPVSPDCQVIIALGTIESTRLALVSLGEDGRIGTNLMAHLRSNIDFRVPRAAFTTLPSGLKALQTSALFMKGQHQFKKPDGTADGVGHFHFQITASGLDQINMNSEAELFQKIPDIDSVNQHLFASDSHVVITIRGIGEMEPDNPNSNITPDRNPMQIDYGERKVFVNLNASARDMELWEVMDTASDQLAAIFANDQNIDIIVRNKGIIKASNVSASTYATVLPHQILDAASGKMVNNPERRDGLGTTHHEAGTLRMGDNAATSVTDVNCRLHAVSNLYAAGPALFPSNGSPNPMLTGIALARRLGDHLRPPPPMPKSGMPYLFDGTQKSADFFKDWLMAGGGSFRIVGRSLIAQPGNQIGLLYYVGKQFDDFTLTLDFCLSHPRGARNDNSGVFVRFRDPRKPVPPGTPGPDVPGNMATVAVDTGYEIQIDEEARGDTRKKEPDGRQEQDGHVFNRTGAIYKVKAQGTADGQQNYTNNQQLAPGVWHSCEIKVTGRTYKVTLNGQPATSFTADASDPIEKFRGRKQTEDPDSGFIGLQVHTGTVAFANIRVA